MAKATRSGSGSKRILDSGTGNADYQSWIADQKIDKTEELTSHTGMVHRLKAASMMQKLAELCERDPSIDPEIRTLVKNLQVEFQLAFISASIEDDVQPNVPLTAPELWSDRGENDDDPIKFIQRVYADYLRKGISKPDIKRLDYSLYKAYYNWKTKKKPIPSDFDELLPTKSATITKKIEEAGLADGNLTGPTREVLSLYRTARNRHNRKKSM